MYNCKACEYSTNLKTDFARHKITKNIKIIRKKYIYVIIAIKRRLKRRNIKDFSNNLSTPTLGHSQS